MVKNIIELLLHHLHGNIHTVIVQSEIQISI